MLMMKKQFFAAIRSGEKTTTLRYWRYAMVKPGSVHNVRGLGRVCVDAVTVVEEAALTDEQARADGFATREALCEALAAMYPPDSRVGRRLYCVRFRSIPDEAAGA
jgi:hypothetical protein